MARFRVEARDDGWVIVGWVIVDEDGYERGEGFDEKIDADAVCDRLNREER